jgi:hypothetical protein
VIVRCALGLCNNQVMFVFSFGNRATKYLN